MEVAGVVYRQAPCFSSTTGDAGNRRQLHSFSRSFRPKRQSNWKSLVGCGDFYDKGHLQFYGYNSGPRMALKEKEKKTEMGLKEKEVKKEMKKKLKLLKNLSKNLSTFSDMGFGLHPENGLDQQVQGQMISEATELLLGQLQKLKEEKLESKRKKKEEKKFQQMMQCNESSSSESCSSSESECENTIATLITHEKPSIIPVEILRIEDPVKKIEVCMGGKCKKSGGSELLENFQAAAVDGVAAVVGCKCMGKCRDGPNVRVHNNGDNTLCMGVGLEDVDSIMNNSFQRRSDREPALSSV